MMHRLAMFLIVACASAVFLSSCDLGGDSDPEAAPGVPLPAPPPPVLVSISVSPDPAIIDLGTRGELSAIGNYSDGTSSPISASWTGFDGIASPPANNGPTIDYYAYALGTREITVADNLGLGIQATASLSVVAQPPPLPTITTTGPFVGGPPPAAWQPFHVQLEYINGSGSLAWEVLPHPAVPPIQNYHQGLPSWISLDPDTGALEGSQPPPVWDPGNGLYHYHWFRVRVSDDAGSDEQDLVIIQWRPAP